MKKLKLDSGFTIIELLIVIIVIAILAALVVASYSGIISRANDATIRSNLKSAIAPAEEYKLENDTYRVSASNNICTLSDAIKVVDSISNIGGGAAACYLHTVAQVAANEWAISAVWNGEYYTVDKHGVAQFRMDGTNSSASYPSRQSYCENLGYRIPSLSQLKALDLAFFQENGSRPIAGFPANNHWSSTDDPADGARAYIINPGNGNTGTSLKASTNRYAICIG